MQKSQMTHQIIHASLVKTSTLPEGIIDPNGAAIGGPIHDGYEVKGFYVNEPTLNEPFKIFRYERNGIEADGVATTSLVTSIDRDSSGEIRGFKTQNSIYRLTTLSYE